MGLLSLSIKEQRCLISIYKRKNGNIFNSYMTEQMLNELVSDVVYALKFESTEGMTEDSLLDLMCRYENIYQIVLKKCSSKRIAKLIKKEMMEIAADKVKTEGMKTNRSDCHQISSYQINKISLSPFDDNRYILSDGISSYAHGNLNITQL